MKSTEPLRQLVEQMPGLAFSLHVQPRTGERRWIHVDQRKAAAFYGVPEAALAQSPTAIMDRFAPEDRVRFEQQARDARPAAAPWSWTGRLKTERGEARWIEMRTFVEPDGEGAQRWFTLALDATERVRVEQQLSEELTARNVQLATSEESREALGERLRRSIDEMSNPILEVWDGVLAMPIVGLVDSRRTADMAQRLLAEVARTQASFVIVDLTGVEVVDTKTADHLIKLMRKVEVIGSRCVLTGIQPAVAETLVDIGVDFGRVTTLRNLKHGLREALNAARREQLDDEGGDKEEPEEGEERAPAKKLR